MGSDAGPDLESQMRDAGLDPKTIGASLTEILEADSEALAQMTREAVESDVLLLTIAALFAQEGRGPADLLAAIFLIQRLTLQHVVSEPATEVSVH